MNMNSFFVFDDLQITKRASMEILMTHSIKGNK